MASAQDTIAERGPVLGRAAVDPALAPVSNVPWAPAESVYLHQYAPVADDDEPADFNRVHGRAPSRLRRAIPLLWAVVLTIAALQHAGEIERRTALREPPVAELEMQARTEREIRAAWRNVGAIAEVKVVERAEQVDQPLAEPLVEKAGGKPLDTEPALLEPITEGTSKTQAAENTAVKPAIAQRVEEKIDAAAAAIESAEVQSQTNAAQIHLPLVEEPEAAKPSYKGKTVISHAPRRQMARSPAPVRARAVKYVALDGHSPQYFTIERPSRASP